MNHQWATNIDKLMLWRTNNWTKYESKAGSFTLRIHYDQLLITSETKVLETFNMNSKMKGIYKEDILILMANVTNQEIRKLKFQIKSDVAHWLRKLGEHFPVMHYNNSQSKNTVHSKYRNIDEVMKRALENEGEISQIRLESSMSVPLPLDYAKFIKLCLLDPTFTQTVIETNKILQEGFYKI